MHVHFLDGVKKGDELTLPDGIKQWDIPLHNAKPNTPDKITYFIVVNTEGKPIQDKEGIGRATCDAMKSVYPAAFGEKPVNEWSVHYEDGHSKFLKMNMWYTLFIKALSKGCWGDLWMGIAVGRDSDTGSHSLITVSVYVNGLIFTEYVSISFYELDRLPGRVLSADARIKAEDVCQRIQQLIENYNETALRGSAN